MLTRRSALQVLAVIGAALAAPPVDAQPLPAGKSRFVFSDWTGPALTVWTYRPRTATGPLRVVFVMHGVQRNGATYRDEWSELAERHRFLLMVPEFTQADFAGSAGYNFGNTRRRDGSAVPRESWSFTAIERIFEKVRQMEPTAETTYRLYGHSAGAQFTHRFLYFMPEARVSRVVVANAGWYTMPNFDAAFPYGLRDSGIEEPAVTAVLKRSVVVQLGDADVDPEHPSLRRSAEAMRQGPHRFARGQAFFAAAKAAAAERGIAFGWRLDIVPGVAHSNAGMAEAAVTVLLAP